jgi:hypothetical protein
MVGAMEGGGDYEDAYTGGGSPAPARAAAGGMGSRGGRSTREDLDDDIPF